MAFLVFEGLDGSGKSSLMAALENELQKRHIAFHRSREPGGTSIGHELRQIILRKEGPSPAPRTELLLYEADRAQHVEEVIRPQLAKGVWVLSDRHAPSSIAFQAGGRVIAQADVEWLNSFATQNLLPDLIILLDLSVEESKKRREQRENKTGLSADRIESEADAFHQRVRQSFLTQAQQDPERWLVLDAQQNPEKLLHRLIQVLQEKKWLV